MRRRTLLVIVAITAVAALLSASAGQSSSKDRTSAAPGVYTYDQAVAAGITLSLQQALDLSGLPLCPPPSEGTGGYPTGKALRDATAHSPEAPTCMADPRLATFSVCNENCIHSGGLMGPGIRIQRR